MIIENCGVFFNYFLKEKNSFMRYEKMMESEITITFTLLSITSIKLVERKNGISVVVGLKSILQSKKECFFLSRNSAWICINGTLKL